MIATWAVARTLRDARLTLSQSTQLAMQRAAVNPQTLRSAGHVSLAVIKGTQNSVLLKILQAFTGIRRQRSMRRKNIN